MTDVELLKTLGAKVGSKLAGTNEYGTDIIEITAIGEKNIIAKCISRKGKPSKEDEGNWFLSLRDWKLVE